MSSVTKNTFFSVAIIFLLVSCVTDYEWEKGMHEFETKLVVNSYLSPDSLMRVTVSETISTLEGYSVFTPDRFDGLVAEISVNGEGYRQMEIDSVHYQTNRPAYILHRKPNVGDTVKLRITDLSGIFGDVHSETIIPSYPDVEFIGYELREEELFKIDEAEADSISKYLKRDYGVELNIVKKGGGVFVKDSLLYMTIRVKNSLEYDSYFWIRPIQYYIPSSKPVKTRDRYLYKGYIFKDVKYVFQVESDILLTVCTWIKPGEPHRFADYYGAITEDMYRYSINYLDAVASESNIFSEPMRLYSNFDGGYGILGSYSMKLYFAQSVYKRWAPPYLGHITGGN